MRAARAGLTPLQLLSLSVVAVSLAAPSHGADQGVAPYQLVVDVVSNDEQDSDAGIRHTGPAPEVLQDELVTMLINAINGERCFETVMAYDPNDPERGDLLLTIEVFDFFEQTEYAYNQAAYQDPNADPDRAKKKIARVEAEFRFFLTTPDRANVLRSKQVKLFHDHVPRHYEDAIYYARNELLEDARRLGRSFACKGSAKKLAKQLAELNTSP
jgi:uncharacterized protein YktA (UPF0223 family)